MSSFVLAYTLRGAPSCGTSTVTAYAFCEPVWSVLSGGVTFAGRVSRRRTLFAAGSSGGARSDPALVPGQEPHRPLRAAP